MLELIVSEKFILAAVSLTVGFVISLVSLIFNGRKRR